MESHSCWSKAAAGFLSTVGGPFAVATSSTLRIGVDIRYTALLETLCLVQGTYTPQNHAQAGRTRDGKRERLHSWRFKRYAVGNVIGNSGRYVMVRRPVTLDILGETIESPNVETS
jgi:hypothetical protein